MVSVFRFCVVFTPLILSLASIILGALAIAGQTKNAIPVNNTYMFKLNLTDATSSVSSAISSGVSSLGLSDIYTFGMWGYCYGSTSDGAYTVSACSTPKAMYLFDPLDTFEEILGSSEITLPDKITDYISTAKVVSKVIFITGLIGVCSAFLTGIFTTISFCSHILSCLAMITGIISFLATTICAAAATGMFSLIKKYFNDDFDTYGLNGSLGNGWFYAFIWAAAAASALTAFFNFFAICCGSTKSKSKSIEEEPMMEYKERGSDSE